MNNERDVNYTILLHSFVSMARWRNVERGCRRGNNICEWSVNTNNINSRLCSADQQKAITNLLLQNCCAVRPSPITATESTSQRIEWRSALLRQGHARTDPNHGSSTTANQLQQCIHLNCVTSRAAYRWQLQINCNRAFVSTTDQLQLLTNCNCGSIWTVDWYIEYNCGLHTT